MKVQRTKWMKIMSIFESFSNQSGWLAGASIASDRTGRVSQSLTSLSSLTLSHYVVDQVEAAESIEEASVDHARDVRWLFSAELQWSYGLHRFRISAVSAFTNYTKLAVLIASIWVTYGMLIFFRFEETTTVILVKASCKHLNLFLRS